MLRPTQDLLEPAIVAVDAAIGDVDRTVAVDLTRAALEQAPSYDPAVPVARDTETAIYKHYGRAGYWPGAAPPSDRSAHGRAGA